ncbi:MAG: YigZ family protein [Anaerolineae bacterium]|nr:YigZ family protein [Anaerolineae bacterium]
MAKIRAEYADASHNVPVFLIGHGNSVIAHSSDDGEPSGTAGRPALAVLQGSGFGDIAVVITRYFGGTKLGTGGLVRAYSDSMREVLTALPQAKKVATSTVAFEMPYSFFERARLMAAEYHGEILDEEFGVNVLMTIRFERAQVEAFRAALLERTQGQTELMVVEENDHDIFPIE